MPPREGTAPSRQAAPKVSGAKQRRIARQAAQAAANKALAPAARPWAKACAARREGRQNLQRIYRAITPPPSSGE